MRHIGVTGHGTRIARMHLRSLERFDFASVLLPYSYVALQDDAYRADVEELLGVCAEREVAVQTIKAIGRRRWPEDHEGRRFSWYEPVTDPAAIGRAVRWVLGHDQLFLNTSSDATLLGARARRAARPAGRCPRTTRCRRTSTPTASRRSSTGRPSSGSEPSARREGQSRICWAR